ncbi:MAG: hypothetical protein Q9209_005038 [Squamulea sp. 1 TL-2023]
MSRQQNFATKQRPAKRNQTLGIQKTTDPTTTQTTRVVRLLNPATISSTYPRRSARLSSKRPQAQAGRWIPPSINEAVPPKPVQQPSKASSNPTKPLPATGQKRQHESEDEFSLQRRRRDSGTVVKSVRELSKANLEEHDRQTKSQTIMSSGKRTLSRRTSTVDISQDTASVSSQKSSSYATYRWIILDSVRIYAENEPVPKNIQTRVDAIIQPSLSEIKEKELSTISNTFCNDFAGVLKGASREDDSVEPIHAALTSIDSRREFFFPRKSDWDANLKPVVKQREWRFNVADKPFNTADDSRDRPSKRQQAASSYISPERSESAIPSSCISLDNSGPPIMPPPAPPKQAVSIVKTPRPDITIGLRDTTVIEKLKAKGLRALEANDFLKALQSQQALCSNPLQPAYPMRFPPLVVEGKSYSTGRPVFEAQNQAAGSGSCMTNLQHTLTELTERTSPGSHQSKEPLAFSICTEGPMMQLWVHYTTLIDGERMYNMNILRICHASTQPFLQEGVKEFFRAVYGVMRWATSEFLDGLVEQLHLIWEAEKRQHENDETS